MRGTHRVNNGGGIEDGVWVTDGTMGFEIPESEYVTNGYSPPLESLAWENNAPNNDLDA